MSSSKGGLKNVFIWFVVAAMATAILVHLSTDQLNRLDKDWSIGRLGNNNFKSAQTQGLMRVLRDATMENGTVIITTLNEAWANPGSIFDIFLESFHIGEETEQFLKHLVVVAMDQKAFERCKSVHYHCYFLATKGIEDFSSEKRFMTPEYVELVWKKIGLMKTVVELGYNFIFTDSDIIWLRNPFFRLPNNTHFAVASDWYYGDPSDKHNMANCGFIYVKSDNQTIQFYKHWVTSKDKYPGKHDQDVFDLIIRDGYTTSSLGLEMRFLDTAYFGGLCQSSQDFNKIFTMHANCCVGMERKSHDLRDILQGWKNYKALSKMEREDIVTFPCCHRNMCRMR